MKDKLIIHWFRQDLRLHDNPALYSAFEEGCVLPVFIFDYSIIVLAFATKWRHLLTLVCHRGQ